MAIYRLFFNKAASLYSDSEIMNTGRDEILEIGTYVNSRGERGVVRSIVQFSTKQLEHLVDNTIGSLDFSASIQLKLAEASEIPTDFSIEANPIAQNWINGTGKFNDTPVNTTGVSWKYRLAQEQGEWTTEVFPPEITGSYINESKGGGTWFFEYDGEPVTGIQSFELNDDLDIDVDVTEPVKSIFSKDIDNNGFILRISQDINLSSTLNSRLRYFSNDTNSIYPPYLEIGWDDSIYSTGSLAVLDRPSEIEVNATNLKHSYFENEVARIKLRARPRFPDRVFTTGSIYLENNALPEQAQWGLKDELTEEMVIPFNSDFTRVSCDSSGPFFNLFMQGLQPEKYYRILFKIPLNGTTVVFDKGNVFKVVRYGA